MNIATKLHYVILTGLIFTGFVVTLPQSAVAACSSGSLSQVGYGMSGAGVSALQTCLIEAGFSIPAGATGYYGNQTVTAVREFYAHELGMPTWNGRSMGPRGRSALVGRLATATSNNSTNVAPVGYKRAGSASELARYLIAETASVGFSSRFLASPVMEDVSEERASADGVANRGADRVSETTVQVAGIDEPDIVKTDGKNIYFSQAGRYYGRPVPLSGAVEDRMIAPDWEDASKTTIVEAFPPEELAEIGEIKEKGEMLLVKDAKILIVLSYPNIVAYDISRPASPVKKWDMAVANNTSLISARLSGGEVYLVTQTWLDRSRPCPYIPVVRGGVNVSIACSDIWVPVQVEPVQHAFTVLSVNPKTGAKNRSVSFAADGSATTMAMFKDNLYLATKSYAARYDVMIDITVAASNRYLSAGSREKIKTIQGYDISLPGKLNEIARVIESDLATLPANERLTVETEIQNVIQKALTTRRRELDRTRIARVSLPGLTIAATGEVPGTLLNQFALDEYNGNLRVAVTVSPNGWWGSGESANDVYVLGSDLKEKGKVVDLGLTERIYAVRFMGDEAYVVTFRQIDPFYVLDLSKPAAPKMVGELKIPGYSAYLEPLGNNLILGVGRDGSNVKATLFDVTNPARPVEKSTYQIANSWTEVEGNHRAFLKDADHSVFFLPASEGGYVLSYANNELTLKAAVAGYAIKRAVYLDDYLYIIGEDKITVLDEITWKEVKVLTLK